MAGQAPNYTNIRWGGPHGIRVPTEVTDSAFLVQKEVDLGSVSGTITLDPTQAAASFITATPTANLTIVYPASNPGLVVTIQNEASATYTITVEVAGNTDNVAIVAANTISTVVHTGYNGGIALGTSVSGGSIGNTVVSGTLAVSGATTLSAAATVGTTLGVTGAFTASSTSHLVGAITADGAATITGILSTGPVRRRLTAITADGAINQHTAANYVFTKAGVAAMTLAAPTATTDDGLILTFFNSTTDQDTITATGLFETGGAAVNVATFPAAIGGTLTIMAYQGKWVVVSNNNVVMS